MQSLRELMRPLRLSVQKQMFWNSVHFSLVDTKSPILPIVAIQTNEKNDYFAIKSKLQFHQIKYEKIMTAVMEDLLLIFSYMDEFEMKSFQYMENIFVVGNGVLLVQITNKSNENTNRTAWIDICLLKRNLYFLKDQKIQKDHEDAKFFVVTVCIIGIFCFGFLCKR